MKSSPVDELFREANMDLIEDVMDKAAYNLYERTLGQEEDDPMCCLANINLNKRLETAGAKLGNYAAESGLTKYPRPR